MRCRSLNPPGCGSSSITPHVWNYHLSMLPGSPWTDVQLRKALNLAIDREGVVGLMNGLAKPAKGQVDPSSPWFGKPSFDIKYDLAAAKKLVEQAGYSKDKPLKTTFIIAQGGTGHRADAVVADERVPAAEIQGNRHRYRLQGGRAGDALYALAQGRGRRNECRHYRQQHCVCDLRPARRDCPLLCLRPDRAGPG